MKTHTCPIDVIDYATDVAQYCLDQLAGVDISTSDASACRRIAMLYLENLKDAVKDLAPEQIERAMDSGRAHLTREYRG